jgi:UDP-4-amino-4,6-dideoxy-N-acetyl-beta-L-altrosamine N-acetyltransferase
MDIRLITLAEEHLEEVRKWRNSPEVAAYMYTDKQISEAEQQKWFERVKNNPSARYWIISYEGRNLGLASVTDISDVFRSCYWAFYLGDSSVRGAGIGGKVEYNVMKYVFEELKLNKLRCEVFVENEKVIRMHEKFGFRREAYYREHCCKNEKFIDVIGLAILRSEWDSMKDSIYKRLYGTVNTPDKR